MFPEGPWKLLSQVRAPSAGDCTIRLSGVVAETFSHRGTPVNGDGVHNWISPVRSSVDTKRLRKIALACRGCFDHCFFTEPPTSGAEYPKPPLSIVYLRLKREPRVSCSLQTGAIESIVSMRAITVGP